LKNREVYEFGHFRLDPVGKVLYRGDEPLPLTRKAVETLLVLVENAPQVVPKEEILSTVWPDRVVEEANLTQNISVIRKAMAASSGDPGHIETFAGRGYRLEGPVVRHVDRQLPAVPEPARATRLRPGWPVVAAVAGVLGITLFLWSILRTRGGDEPPVVGGLQPVTRMPGKEFQPAISPDGRLVAFLWAPAGETSPRLWIRDLEDGQQRQLSQAPGHHSSPAWSADGRRVAFLRIGARSAELVVAPLSGGSEQLVTEFTPPAYGFDQRLLDWSPDGRTFVVSHMAKPGGALGLSLVNLETAERRSLTQPDVRAGSDIDPRFSPDGRLVTFLRSTHRGQQELYSVPAAGGAPRAWTRDSRQISAHAWEFSGAAIYYVSDKSGEFRLWRQGASGGDSQPLGLLASFPVQFSLARSAPFAVYAELNQDRNIWEFDIPTERWTRLIASTGQDASPQYSPDGREICFRSDRSGQDRLWIASSDGARQSPVTPPGIEPSVGRWSPDGSTIVFNTPKTGAIYLLRRDAAAWKLQPLNHRGVHPVFSRDGNFIFAGGTTGIVSIPVGGGPARPALDSPGMSLDADPSGQFLLFVRESLDSAIWRGDLARKTVAKVLDGLVPGCTSCWAFARGGIYYLGTTPESLDHQALFYFDLAAGKSTLLAPYPEPIWPLGSGPFSLSPDGRKLLCVRLDSPSSDLNRITISRR
jgi:Tol biopolymer transport system component/DNA-binding winged helix-turn-helix (wHTH) protein